VLQKLIGGCGAIYEFALRGQPERLVEDPVLCKDIPLGNLLDLAFVELMHGFVPLDGPLCRNKRSEP
jgi:hypothetical protein